MALSAFNNSKNSVFNLKEKDYSSQKNFFPQLKSKRNQSLRSLLNAREVNNKNWTNLDRLTFLWWDMHSPANDPGTQHPLQKLWGSFYMVCWTEDHEILTTDAPINLNLETLIKNSEGEGLLRGSFTWELVFEIPWCCGFVKANIIWVVILIVLVLSQSNLEFVW